MKVHKKIGPIDVFLFFFGFRSSEYCSLRKSKQLRHVFLTNIINVPGGMKEKCSLVASTSMFGEPCPGTSKYLSVAYKCVAKGELFVTPKFLLILEQFHKNFEAQIWSDLFPKNNEELKVVAWRLS